MKDFTPYDVLAKVLEIGESMSLRELAELLSGAGEDLDQRVVDLESLLTDYRKKCDRMGEEPLVVLNPITDEVESPCLIDVEEHLLELTDTVKRANRAWLSYYLRHMTWENFEFMCKELLGKMGVAELELTNRGPDHGIDFIGVYFNPMLEEMVVPIVGQAKRWSATSPVRVNEVRGVIAKLATHDSPAVQGFLMTTSYFTKYAIQEAERSPKKIHLWDLGQLIDRILEFKVGISPVPSAIEVVDRPHWDRFLEGG
jgi:restriction endonuclease Mrr